MGVDTDFFKPFSKEKCRDKLGLPKEKFLVFYIGRFDDSKGLPFIIDAVKNLQDKYDIELVAVGGSLNDPLFPLVNRVTKYIFNRINYMKMPIIFNAADVLPYYFKNFRWSGPSVTVMEAMSCNKFIVSNTLIHLLPIISNLNKYGCYIPKSPKYIEPIIEHLMIESPSCNTRFIAKMHFGWKPIIENTKRIYKSLTE
jgi:glycosyltransferase involved in cell wall biosynthesis